MPVGFRRIHSPPRALIASPGPRLAFLRSGVVDVSSKTKIRVLTRRRLWVIPFGLRVPGARHDGVGVRRGLCLGTATRFLPSIRRFPYGHCPSCGRLFVAVQFFFQFRFDLIHCWQG